ncbi:MAG: TolC family outer membrane protein [Thiotrichales bacterium]|nr:TolC family outer membrane protein [Thiotrichales bacterium]
MSLPVQAGVVIERLDLPGAVETTLNFNADLLAKQSQLQADQENIAQAKAKILPNIRLNGNVGYGDYKVNGVSGVEDRYQRVSVAVVQPLYAQRTFLGVDRAEMGVAAATTQFELDQNTKTLELIQAYLEFLKFSRLHEISQLELQDHQVRVDRIQAMLERGLATKMDLLEANSTFDILRANALQVESDMRIRKVRLQQLLGSPVNQLDAINEQLWQRSAEIVGQSFWFATAFANHPSLRLAQQQQEVARIDIQTAKAGYQPELLLRAEISDSETLETSIEGSQKIQLELSFPLYEGGDTDSKVRQSRAVLNSRDYQVADRQAFLRVKLEETFARMQGNLAKIAALNESVESSRAYLDAAQKGLSYGLRGVFDVLEAKARVYDARKEVTVEIYDNLLSQFEFLYLIGRLQPQVVRQYLQEDFVTTSLR